MFTYKKNILFCLITLFMCANYALFSQTGINTTHPRKTLEVGGNMHVNGSIEIGTVKPLKDSESSTFLIQDTDNTIKAMDVSNPTGSALGYIQQYIITNPQGDWILNFDTGVDATDYVLITTSANYDKELVISNSINNAKNNGTLPYTSTFIENGTWHIIADFPVASNYNESEIGTWTINTLIFSKDLSKRFGTITIPMLGGTTGSAVIPIID